MRISGEAGTLMLVVSGLEDELFSFITHFCFSDVRFDSYPALAAENLCC